MNRLLTILVEALSITSSLSLLSCRHSDFIQKQFSICSWFKSRDRKFFYGQEPSIASSLFSSQINIWLRKKKRKKLLQEKMKVTK